MSASEASVFFPSGPGRRSQEQPVSQGISERFTPKQGWDTFVLMMAAVGVAAWTVREADWVETPGLLGIVAASSLTGLLLAKVRLPWPLLHPVGLAVGFVVVVWQALLLIEGQPLADQLREMWNRLDLWYEAATTEGISTDLLPFTLALLAMTWLLGYVSVWFLFRNTNVWVGLILTGLAILTNLSFLPEGFASRFFLFMFFALLLVARVSMIQRQDHWRKVSVRFVPGGTWVAIRAAAALSIVVLVVAAFLPLRVYVSKSVIHLWNLGRAPIETIEDEFGRLFAGIASRKDVTGRFFGNALAFQGKISFGGDIVLWADTEHPSNWLSRTYSEYTPQGWKAGETTKRRVGPDTLPPPPQESFKRDPMYQKLQLSFDTNDLLHGGNVDWISREADVETLAPKEFTISLLDESRDAELPEDIQELATTIRRAMNPIPTSSVESHIAQLLPLDLVLIGLYPSGPGSEPTDRSGPMRVTVARKEPTLPDVVSWKLVDRLYANESYVMRSYVSMATEEDLRSAGTNYSGFLKDHYLQLPADLPQRVRDLAAERTENADTPVDKALAVQEYLRGDTFEFSRDINAPPRGVDGVDHFLFEAKVGYSDYFASAMAVLLRAAGVPARLAAGYAPGELKVSAGQRAVRDSDSHTWTQVYFPGHGWVDFEPTPNWRLPEYGAPTLLAASSDTQGASEEDGPRSLSGNRSTLDRCLEATIDVAILPFECENLSLSESAELEALLRGGGAESRDYWSLAVRTGIGIGALAGLWLIGWAVWTGSLSNATPTERTYTKMSRLGSMAGLGRRSHQTPMEYATGLGNAIPAIAIGALDVARAFAASRYGKRVLMEPDDQDPEAPDEMWKGIRGRLLTRALRRLVPVGGP